MTTDNKGLADRLEMIVASMRNFAGVADSCELTEGNAPAAIRTWADMLVEEQAALTSPQAELTDSARGALAWVLYHHQGGSSPVGQPIRFALGLGAHDPLPDLSIAEAKRYAEWAGSKTADFHTPQVSGGGEEWRAKADDLLQRLSVMQPPNVVLQQITMLGEARDILHAALATPQARPAPINPAPVDSKSTVARPDSGEPGDTVMIGAALCYGEDDWFKEFTVEGVRFLVPLDDQDRGRHVLAAKKRRSSPAPAPDVAQPMELPLTETLRGILGKPCFTLIHTANVLRKMGHEIRPKAEDEQAVCLHWMLNLYLRHGDDWGKAGQAEIEAVTTAQQGRANNGDPETIVPAPRTGKLAELEAKAAAAQQEPAS